MSRYFLNIVLKRAILLRAFGVAQTTGKMKLSFPRGMEAGLCRSAKLNKIVWSN